MNDNFLLSKLAERKADNALRRLRNGDGLADFSSNDYLGLSYRQLIGPPPENADVRKRLHGSTGSRLISGNYPLIEETESQIALFHKAAAGLIFNSGYDANIGLLGCVAQRTDIILYDRLSHASVRDGIRLSFARSFSFLHNDLADLEKKLQIFSESAGQETGSIFVVTESVFSMDGDMAPLKAIAELCSRYQAKLIVDEAHATGIIGENGAGLVAELGIEQDCFARVITFGKALGCHGAIVLGSVILRDFLINFSRPFIYTTAMPAVSVYAIKAAYSLFPDMKNERAKLRELVVLFKNEAEGLNVRDSGTPIQPIIIPGNEQVKKIAAQLQSRGMDVRPIVYPTVARGEERLRIVLHAFNTPEETESLAGILKTLNAQG